MRSIFFSLILLATSADAKPPARSLTACVQRFGAVDMSCIGPGVGVTLLRESSTGASSVVGYEDVLRSTLPEIRGCHERSSLAKHPGHVASIKVKLTVAPDGSVSTLEHSTQGIDDDATLVDCLTALFRPLHFAKPASREASREGGEVDYAVSFTTVIPSRSVDQEAAEMCQVAKTMKADPSWPRDKVLMETAVRWDQLQPSSAVRRLLDSLATTPREKLYSAWRGVWPGWA